MEQNWIRIKNFAHEWDAKIAQEVLENKNIKTMIQKGDLAASGDFVGGTGDRDLFVMKKDYENAKQILEDINLIN